MSNKFSLIPSALCTAVPEVGAIGVIADRLIQMTLAAHRAREIVRSTCAPIPDLLLLPIDQLIFVSEFSS